MSTVTNLITNVTLHTNLNMWNLPHLITEIYNTVRVNLVKKKFLILISFK